MSSRRSLRRVAGVACGLVVLGLSGIVIWHRNRDGSSTPAPMEGEVLQPETQREVRFLNDVPVRLGPGQILPGELKGLQGFRYEIDLAEGQFARVVVEQRGVDVAVSVYGPGQEHPGMVDSPNGSQGPEVVYQLAQQSGVHRLEVVCEDPAASSGHYEIRFEELRDALPEDRALYEAWRLFRRGEGRRQAGALAEALSAFEAALPAWRGLGQREWEAETLHRIGWIEVDLGRYAEALEAFEAALPWFRKNGSRVREGEILNRIGRVSFALGDSERALEYGERARKLAQEIDRPGIEAEALYGLGDVWFRRGETEKALDLHLRSRDLARTSGDPESLVLALLGIGECYLYAGQFGPAQDALGEALQVTREAAAVRLEGNVLRALADLHLRRREIGEARIRVQEAMALERAQGNRNGEAVLLNNLGVLALEEGQPDEARTWFETALALSRQTDSRYTEAFTLLNLGRALFDAQDVAGALREHDEAARAFEQLGHRRGLVSTLYGSARALNALGRFEEARSRLEQVGADTELLRGGSQSPSLRSTFFATKQHYFDLYVDVLMNLHEQQPAAGYDHLAVAVNERRRARSLLEELGGRVAVPPDADPELVARRRELSEAIEAAERDLLLEPVLGERSAQSQQRIRSLLAELDRVRTALRAASLERSSLSEPRPLSLKAMQGLLDADTMMMIFSLGDARSHLWCVANHGRIESRALPGRAWIEDRVRLLSRIWSRKVPGGRGEQERRLARELSDELLGPVAHLLGSRRLLVVSDGELQKLSFAALPDPNAARDADPAPPLLARHEIVYLPSASVLAAARRVFEHRAQAPGKLIVLADPVFGPHDPRVVAKGVAVAPKEEDPSLRRAARNLGVDPFCRLPFSGREAEAVSRFYPNGSRVLSGFQADLEAVEQGALEPYGILHFATHALVDPEFPELSGLVLSQIGAEGGPRKGFLRAHRIADLDLRAELAVLSACETGVGTDLRGEGAQALTRSFLRAGVPRLVVSLWEVSDAGTAVLMERFYRGMTLHRLSPSQALRCAQLSLLGTPGWAAPYYWAPFVFQGEWEKRMGKVPASDDPIERQPGGGIVIAMPDDGFPSPGDDKPPASCPDLTGAESVVLREAP